MCNRCSTAGRTPGNGKNEVPDIRTLSESNLKFIDGAAGIVPPLLGKKFFSKYRANKSVAEFSAHVSSAANTFPAANMKVPNTYFQIAAYVLYRNCGKM